MKCTIFYRTYGGENKALRPDWYSKELCLRSLLQAFKVLQQDIETDLFIIYDGSLDYNFSWPESLLRLVSGLGSVIELPKSNNAVSCLDTIKRACDLEPDRAIFFAEDDYLWLPNSLRGMIAALTELPVDYVTAYDHPVRYQPDYPLGADWPHWDTTIYLAGGHHWRTQESTCMTFGARVITLQEDLAIFQQYHNNGKNVPNDRALFRHLQGLGQYAGLSKRRLVGPVPSLNTHAHLPWLAPAIDWKSMAKTLLDMN